MPATSAIPSTAAAANEPPIGAEPADRDHDQHIDEEAEAEGGVEPDDLDGKRAAEPGKAAAQRESDGEHGVDVDAEPLRDALVVDCGANPGAEARVVEAEDQQRGDGHSDDAEEDAVDAEALAGEFDGALQIAGKLDRLLAGAEDLGSGGRRHEDEADGEQHLVELAGAVETAEDRPLERHADDRRARKATGRVSRNGAPNRRISVAVT